MSKKLNTEVGIIEKIKSDKLPALLRDKKKMAAIALSAESGSMKDLDACMLYSFLDSLAPQEEKPEQPQVASEIEIARKMVLLRRDLTVNSFNTLHQLVEIIETYFKDTGYKIPLNRENDTSNALQVGVSNEDVVNSFPVNIKENEYLILLKKRSVVVVIIGPSGQRIPVAF